MNTGTPISYKVGTVTHKGRVLVWVDDRTVLVSDDATATTQRTLPASALTDLTPTPPPPPPPPPVVPPGADASKTRPYDARSPWNTPIGNNPTLVPQSDAWITRVATKAKLPLTCDPDQYTIPVVSTDSSVPLVTVKGRGYYGEYLAGDAVRKGGFGQPWTVQVPIPANSPIGVGSDGQLEVVNWQTGEQWGFWQLNKQADGTYSSENGYRYKIGPGNYGRFADGNAGRGAGTPYLAGLVRRWEIDQGVIEHALAFAYAGPGPDFVYPASKSDGGGFGGVAALDMPEGSRIQLDPGYDVTLLTHPVARIIAKALQVYGAYTIDNSGSSKLYLEDRRTAGWDPSVTRDIVSGIPWTAFRVVAPPPVV